MNDPILQSPKLKETVVAGGVSSREFDPVQPAAGGSIVFNGPKIPQSGVAVQESATKVSVEDVMAQPPHSAETPANRQMTRERILTIALNRK